MAGAGAVFRRIERKIAVVAFSVTVVVGVTGCGNGVSRFKNCSAGSAVLSFGESVLCAGRSNGRVNNNIVRLFCGDFLLNDYGIANRAMLALGETG